MHSFNLHQTVKHLGELTQVWVDDTLLYQYQLSAVPGCAYLGVSSRVWLSPILRGQGLGSQLHQDRLDAARELGFTTLLCTVNNHNRREIRILEKFGWSLQFEIKDHGEYSTVMYSKNLKEN